jgi:hypothetical protein
MKNYMMIFNLMSVYSPRSVSLLILVEQQKKEFSLAIYAFFFLRQESHYAAQADLKLMILLPQPLSAGVTGVYHHTQPSK